MGLDDQYGPPYSDCRFASHGGCVVGEVSRGISSCLFFLIYVLTFLDTIMGHTPWKFNIAPENGWLEDEFPFGIPYFQGLC